jgi:diguanylate cyclase (GGDEF)-like protein
LGEERRFELLESQRQGREIVRRIAMLLSGERPLAEVLHESGELLGEVFGACVEIAYTDPNGTQCLYRADGAERAGGETVRVPVIFAGVTLGELRLTTQAALDARDVQLLEACGVYLGARLHDEQLRLRSERYERLALTDALTGVANRRAFDERLVREWGRARRNGSSVSLLMIDIDLFKGYNDTYGHRAGDQCLHAVAAAACACLRRPGDFFARFGGEEFVALLPETELEGALTVAESMRGAVERLGIARDAGGGCVTVSIGASHCVPREDGLANELVSSADAALYAAKSEGRNRVVGAHALFPADYDARAVIGNLPPRSTRFIGHADEVMRLAGALEGNPIVTVTGPGGVGKTRVSIEVARRTAAFFPDGVWFVNLPMLDDGSDVTPFVCEILRGLAPLAHDAASLAHALADKRLLLLFDSCEHVIEPASALARTIAQSAPQVRILATSREPLHVPGEVAHRLGSLRIEDAVELFLDRAMSAGATGLEERRSIVAAIVEQLDAIPLAIELAAPQLASMSPDVLLRRIDDRLAFLRMEIRGAEHRQQTLEAMLDWSHRLLNENSCLLFRRLAIFVGGFTLEAAMCVCSDGAFNEARLSEALEDLAAKSLLVVDPLQPVPRYRMLEITRAYAQRLLFESNEYDEAASAHVRYYKALARRFEGMIDAMPVVQWQNVVQAEAQNMRAALTLSLDAGDLESAAAICEAIHFWMWEHGSVHAGDLTRRLAVALTTNMEAPTEAALRVAYASLLRHSDRVQALEAAKRAYDLYRGLGDTVHIADALRVVGSLQHDVYGTPSLAMAAEFELYAERMFERGSTLRAAELLNNLGVAHAQTLDKPRLREAQVCFERAAGLLEARGDGQRAGRVTGNSAATAYLLGDAEEAVRWSRRAVAFFDRAEPTIGAGHQWGNHGFYLTVLGSYEEAKTALLRALHIARDLGDRVGMAGVLNYLGYYAHRTGNHALAARFIGRADVLQPHDVARQHGETVVMDELIEALRASLGDGSYEMEHKRGASTPTEALAAEL